MADEADEADDTGFAEVANRVIDVFGIDIDVHSIAVGLQIMNPWVTPECLNRPHGLRGDRGAREVEALCDRVMQSWSAASMSGSRPEVGSSRMRSSAFDANAAMRPTF